MGFAKYVLVAAVAATVIGCEKAEDKKAADANMNKVDQGVKDATKSMDDAKAKTADASAKAADAMDMAKDKGADAAKMAGDAAAGTEIPGVGKVSDVMTKIQDYIKDKKFDDAQTLVDKVDAVKDKLPDAVKTQFENVKGMLGKAKEASKMMGGAPAMPTMPK